MTSPISNNPQNGVPPSRLKPDNEPAKQRSVDEQRKADDVAKMVNEVLIDPNIEKALNSSGFDQANVNSIKTALEQGNYPLDDRKIAESFIPLEKLL
jgi:negative regulator of flagellin synthesis FlgM